MVVSILYGVQAVISILLIGCVLLQSKGQGFSMTFGGGMGVYRTRRGAEGFVFKATIALGVLFGLASLVLVMLSQ
jgi:protein translocase SecG subunit